MTAFDAKSWKTYVKMPCDFTNRKQTVHAVHVLNVKRQWDTLH